ncbi:MAG: radical SAM protein, partial [Cyanobacteria bacterium NC_groundwater_1444_Ag_S-0.65um_54_12]|nr:radical SAM protein [Cyanobacteria bacterium NC_groundwater_1444_Ag_S-0.65um_54_12]
MEPSLRAVYGPVNSWRLGRSLGVDLLLQSSICSFRCIYCQLGKIQIFTNERRIFVPTTKVLADFAASNWQNADVITLSGNGEPTLALNLGECLREIKARTDKPLIVLTNATLLGDPLVRADLQYADRVFLKLDAATPRLLQIINQPLPEITLETILAGIEAFAAEFSGYLAVQTMIMPASLPEVAALCALLVRIAPAEVQ